MQKHLKTNGAKAISNTNRGRKSPRGLSIWEDKFKRKLRRHHKHFAKKVFHRLMKKSSTLRTTLKRRSKEYEVEFIYRLQKLESYCINLMGESVITAMLYCLSIIWHVTIFTLFLWAVIQLLQIYRWYVWDVILEKGR